MTKKKVGIIALIIIIISAVVMVFAYGIKNKQVVVSEDDKMKIVVTSFPQYDFARAVAGDKANIQMLIKPGVETHSYEPTPDDIQKIQNADLFIYTGGENDEWVEGILDSIDTSSLKTLKLEDCVDLIEEDETVGLEGVETHSHSHNHDHDDEHNHDHDNEEGHDHDHDEDEHDGHNHSSTDIEYDEHVWLSLKNAERFVNEISESLVSLDSANADAYSANAKAYNTELEALDKEYSEAVSSSTVKTLLFADRFPFRYMVADYGLSYYAAFDGCAADTNASFETVTFLAKKVDELGLKHVLKIDGSDGKIAKTVVENTNDKNQDILELDSMQSVNDDEINSGTTYLSIMKSNLEVLKKALS